MPDKDPLRAQALLRQIIGALCPPLYLYGYDLFPFNLPGFIVEKHGDVRLDAVPDHIDNLLCCPVRVLHPGNAAVIGNTDV